jgi:dTDP-4-amino-4,6-dideoxygalactose transaminase
MKNIQKLALCGGDKLIEKPFNSYNTIGKEEKNAAIEVIESGVLSKFLGTWGPDFFGGSKVQEFERQCEAFFEVKHAIVVNSWTSGLIMAVGAIGIEPGDEIIVTPWTMSASATAILHWNAIPVFADIEPHTFCIDPKSIEEQITSQTKAIMVVDIFGHSANMKSILAIAKKNNLKVISDTAQAPGAMYHGKYAGTLADIGGYSLNYHKHIHTGEGGILVTNSDLYADKLRLIRNHAEVVVESKGNKDLSNMIGFNFRLGEIESAIGIEQIKKLPKLIKSRQKIAERLSNGLSDLKGLKIPYVESHCTHVYYVYPIVLDIKLLKISKESIAQALTAEGVLGITTKYQNIHLLPMYQEKIAYGSKGFPWNSEISQRDVDYSKGICPIAETLQDDSFIAFAGISQYDLSKSDVDLIISAFKKVWSNLESLS